MAEASRQDPWASRIFPVHLMHVAPSVDVSIMYIDDTGQCGTRESATNAHRYLLPSLTSSISLELPPPFVTCDSYINHQAVIHHVHAVPLPLP